MFREYARDVFRNLRVKYLNIKDEEYLSSLCDFPYSELGVSGRSGSFLYISHDNRFIIKTITPGESKFFRKVLPHYYNVIIFILLCFFPPLFNQAVNSLFYENSTSKQKQNLNFLDFVECTDFFISQMISALL